MMMGVNAGARLDRLPASGYHARLATLIGAGMFFDGFDLFLAANVLGALAKSGFSNLALNGSFVSATFIGMTIGAFLSGWVGDKFGRRVTYQVNLLIFGLASLAGAFAPNMEFLIAARFVMGVGLGAEIVVGYATFTEFLPPAVRGKWLGILGMPMQIALFVGAFVGFLVIPHFGWRPMFGIAAVGALIVWYLRKNLPESPRWLEQKGRFEEAEAVTRMIEEQCGQPPGTALALQADTTYEPTRFSNPKFLLSMFVGASTVIVLNITVFGFLSFVPTFFVQEGMNIQKSLGFSTLMTLGGPVGGLITLFYADRIGRKALMISSAIVTAIIGCFYPFVGEGYMIAVVGFLLVSALYTNSTTGYSMFVPELFPTDVRLRSVGTCHTIGRIAGAAAPLASVYLFTHYGIGGVIALMSGLLVVQALIIWTLGVESRFRSLEALNEELEAAPNAEYRKSAS
ncbi:MAG TPA: MFS transporter [Stellaceae bacterium]|jgi:putative MFS transporter|nr:MFS transporter [Stellaceae bacterium]